MEHRSGLIVKALVTPATGRAERDAALVMVGELRGQHRITVAGDKGYDTRDFVATLRAMRVTPHVAQYTETVRRAARSTRARRVIRAMRSVSGNASWSNKASAG